MLVGNRKEEGRVCTALFPIIWKSLAPNDNRLTAILNWKKPKSFHGLKPGLLRQNAIALPLVPPPLPFISHSYKIYKRQNWPWIARCLRWRTWAGWRHTTPSRWSSARHPLPAASPWSSQLQPRESSSAGILDLWIISISIGFEDESGYKSKKVPLQIF